MAEDNRHLHPSNGDSGLPQYTVRAVAAGIRLEHGTFERFLFDRLLVELKLGPADKRLELLKGHNTETAFRDWVDDEALAALCDRIGEELRSFQEGHERVRRALIGSARRTH